MVPVSNIFMQLSTTVCVMLMFAHVAACMLVLVAKLEGMPEGSWMVQYGAHCRTPLLGGRLCSCASALSGPKNIH